MCKFESDHAPGYRTVSTAIREWIADAPDVIPIRWEVEEDQRRVRANLDNFERGRLYVSTELSSQETSVSGLTSLQQGSAQVVPATHPQTIGRFMLPAGQGYRPQGQVLRVAGAEETTGEV